MIYLSSEVHIVILKFCLLHMYKAKFPLEM